MPPARLPASSCSNGWKIRAVSCAAIPIPVSATTILTSDRTVRAIALADASKRIEPRSVNLRALLARLMRICFTLAPSPRIERGSSGAHSIVELDALGRGLASEHPLDLVERRPGIEPILDELGVAGLDLGHLEHVVHERQQMIPARAHDPDLLLLRPAERGVALEELRVPQDDVQRVADLVGHVGEKLALGLVGALGFILGVAELARARRDELLQPLAVGAELGHVVHLSDDPEGPTVVIGDDRHGEERPHGLAVLSEKTFLDGVGRDVEQAPELHLVGPEVVRVRDVAQPSCAELLGGPPEDTAERAVDPEKPSVEREQGLPDRAVLEGGLELPLGGGHPRAARRVLPREEERHAEHVDRVRQGARVRRPDLREVDEEPDRDSGQDRRRADGDEDRAGPIALPDRAGDEESIDLDRQHRRDTGGRGTRREACGSAAGPCRPRAAASFAARGRFRAAAPIGSGRRGRPARP